MKTYMQSNENCYLT